MANNILVNQPNGTWVLIATVEVGGVHTVTVSTAAANSFVQVPQPNGEWARLATVLATGVHTVCATAAA